jgi:hypothetical protein
MRIHAISGDGMGAGKTFLATKLAPQNTRLSLAAYLRADLSRMYPNYDWYNRTQDYKDNTMVHETGKTVREMLMTYGASKREVNADYWVSYLLDNIYMILNNSRDRDNLIISIDDVRFLNEIEKLRSAFGSSVTHFHVISSKAKSEPFDNEALRDIADYIIQGTAHA